MKTNKEKAIKRVEETGCDARALWALKECWRLIAVKDAVDRSTVPPEVEG